MGGAITHFGFVLEYCHSQGAATNNVLTALQSRFRGLSTPGLLDHLLLRGRKPVAIFCQWTSRYLMNIAVLLSSATFLELCEKSIFRYWTNMDTDTFLMPLCCMIDEASHTTWRLIGPQSSEVVSRNSRRPLMLSLRLFKTI